jgi:hypothetical protein
MSARMDEPLDRLTKSDERADEDREHDRESGPQLTREPPLEQLYSAGER